MACELFPWYHAALLSVTREAMIEVDRLMTESYQIALIQMMENAGRSLAHLARLRFLEGEPTGKNVVILAGTGGNGGGALVCARRLHTWGARVQIVTTRPREHFSPTAAHQLASAQHMQIPLVSPDAITQVDSPVLIIDGLVGYRLQGNPRGSVADLIRWANAQPCPILSLDLPSGIDATTGAIGDPAIRATATMTLALPKTGLCVPDVATYVGELYLADISVPPALYTVPPFALSVPPLFAQSELLRLR